MVPGGLRSEGGGGSANDSQVSSLGSALRAASPQAGTQEKGAGSREKWAFSSGPSNLKFLVVGHPSRDGQWAAELEDLGHREEKWTEDADLGDGPTQVYRFQIFDCSSIRMTTGNTQKQKAS